MVGEESGLVGSIICWEKNAAVILVVVAAIAKLVIVVFATVSAVILLVMRPMAKVEIILILMLQVGRGKMWC